MSKLTTLRQLVISIHALHEESDLRTPETSLTEEISIHALHEESDRNISNIQCYYNISIHALHEESDIAHDAKSGTLSIFQSTLSMRRATSIAVCNGSSACNFNPRSP